MPAKRKASFESSPATIGFEAKPWSAINQHLKRLFSDNELEPGATVKKYLIVQTEGNRLVERSVEHYSLQAIISTQDAACAPVSPQAKPSIRDFIKDPYVLEFLGLPRRGSYRCHSSIQS